MPPHLQTLHCSRDNFKIPYWIAIHFLDVDWCRCEDIWGARWAQSDYWRATPNSQYMKNWWLLLYLVLHICLLCDKIFLPQHFGTPGSIEGPPQECSHQITSLFDMYIDLGERISGTQDGPSLTPPPQKIAKKLIFVTLWPFYEKLVNSFSLYIRTPLWWGLPLLILWYP